MRIAVVLLVLLGAGVRVAGTFPVHKYPADADALLVGLCACDVLEGDVRVFLAAERIGALECYVTAGMFAMFGSSRAVLGWVGPLLALLTMLAAYALFRELFDDDVALVALLLFALPSPAVLFWTYMPTSYPTTFLLCTVVLWLAARIARRGATTATILAFGIAVGLGFWQSFLTLTCSIPALLLVAMKTRRRALHALILVIGFTIGALPWIAFNVRYQFATFAKKNFGANPTDSISGAIDNLHYATMTNAPQLVASIDPERSRALSIPLLLIHIGVVIWLIVAARRGRISRDACVLLVALVLVTLALNTFSQAGQTRVLSVRYLLALWFVAVAALASATIAIWKRNRAAAVILVAVVLVFHISGYRLPGQPYRERAERDAAIDEQLTRHFLRTNTRALVGSYWTTYPFTFLTQRKVLALPCRAADDYEKLRELVPPTPVRIAMIEEAREAKRLSIRMQRANIAGNLRIVGRYVLFEPLAAIEPQHAILAACNLQ